MVMFIGFQQIQGQDTIDFEQIDYRAYVYITDSTYSIWGGDNIETEGKYVFVCEEDNPNNNSRSNSVYIRKGDYPDSAFVFSDMYINTSGLEPFVFPTSTDTYTFYMVGTNYMRSNYRKINLTGNSMILKGDSLTFQTWNSRQAANFGYNCGYIKVDNDYFYVDVETTGTDYVYPAIGGYDYEYCDSIIFNESVVTAKSSYDYDISAEKIIINGGSVYGTLSTPAVNSNGDSLYCLTLPNNGFFTFTMNDGTKDSTVTFKSHHPDDNNYYLYLQNGNYSFVVGDTTYLAMVNGADTVADPVKSIDISSRYMTFSDVMSSKTLSITCNNSWEVTNNSDWITTSETSGTGDKDLTISVSKNDVSLRTGSISLTDLSTGAKRALVITQRGENAYLAFDQDTIYMPQSGGSGTFNISSNTKWFLVESDTNMIKANVDTVNGDGEVSFTLGENNLARREFDLVVTILSEDTDIDTIIKQVIVVQDCESKAVTIDISECGSNKVKIYDSYFEIGDSTTNYKGAYVITGTSSELNAIYIYDGTYADTVFNFENISDSNRCLVYGNTSINLKGANQFICESGFCFGIKQSVTFTGDSLFTTCPYNYGQGVYALGNVTFNNKYVYAESQGSSDYYPAIGYKTCNKITINGTTLTAINSGTNQIVANDIIINGGSVKGTLSRNALNASGDTVYCVTVANNGSLTLQMNDGSSDTTLSFYALHPDDSHFYVYLPNGSYSFENGDGATYYADVDGANTIASLDTLDGDGVIDVTDALSVIVTDSVYTIGAQPYKYSGHKFTFSGATTYGGVDMQSNIADTIYLDGVDIELTGECAFDINTGKDVTVILKDGTVNTFISGGKYPGLHKIQTEGMLTISGTGTLNATGGEEYAPGIGSIYSTACSNITIEGGVVNATGADYAAGIGSGRSAVVTNIYIKGGTVTSTPGYYAFCIGSMTTGEDYNSDIVISGGILKLLIKENSAKFLPYNTTIAGGTITSEFESSKTLHTYLSENTVITGGSVNLLDASGNVAISEDTYRPTNEYDSLAYRSQYLIPNISEPTLISSITIDDSISWGCSDMYTDSTGLIYLWLPIDDATAYEMTKVVISIDGASYTYNGQIDASDELVEGTKTITASGNYFYQVPVSITTENTTLAVTDFDGNSITDGSYITSGLLEDNKVHFTYTAVADTGYTNPEITIGNAEEGSSYFIVSAEEDDTLKIAAVSDILYYNLTSEVTGSGSISIATSDGATVLSGDTVSYGTWLTIAAAADEGYQLDSMIVNDVVDTTSEVSHTVSGDVSIAAYFSVKVTETGETGVASELSANTWVYSNDNLMYVHSVEGAVINVYNISGVLVSTQQSAGNITEIPVNQSGVYLLNVLSGSGSPVVLKCVVK